MLYEVITVCFHVLYLPLHYQSGKPRINAANHTLFRYFLKITQPGLVFLSKIKTNATWARSGNRRIRNNFV